MVLTISECFFLKIDIERALHTKSKFVNKMCIKGMAVVGHPFNT